MRRYTLAMDRLWTPWRYNYVTGVPNNRRQGVPEGLDDWPGPDRGCVFCNLIESVRWAIAAGRDIAEVERAGWLLARDNACFTCLNAFPYSSGHLLIVPYRHLDSLAKLPAEDAAELIHVAQTMESALRAIYHPQGINLGMNLGEAAGAGVAGHLHLHLLPRWFGDTNFMTVTAETRVLPEALSVTWNRLREYLRPEGSRATTGNIPAS